MSCRSFIGVQAEQRLLSCGIDRKVACHPEKPWFKAGAPVVGVSSLQNPEPGFLHQVVYPIASTQQGNEIANEPVLVLLDQRLQNSDISLAQPKRYSCRIAFHERPRSQLITEHTLGIRNRNPKLRRTEPVATENSEQAPPSNEAARTFHGISTDIVWSAA